MNSFLGFENTRYYNYYLTEDLRFLSTKTDTVTTNILFIVFIYLKTQKIYGSIPIEKSKITTTTITMTIIKL